MLGTPDESISRHPAARILVTRTQRITAMIENRNERRATPRHQVLKGATIAFGGNGLPCIVHNLSAGGAALDFASSISLPPSFMLEIKADRFIRRCRPVWSHDTRIGVAFD
jgi:hypothetical protein